jgi:hypothetical protein
MAFGNPKSEITKEDLRRMYHQEQKTLREIGEHYGGVSRQYIQQVMVRFGIERDRNRRGDGRPLEKERKGRV